MLINDPVVKGMNSTQWVFELDALNNREEKRFEETRVYIDLFRRHFVSLLGLDLMPIEEVLGTSPDGEDIVRYRRPEDHEIMPLVAFIGREEVMKVVGDRHQEMQMDIQLEELESQGEEFAHRTPEELEELMNSVPVFLDDPEVMRKKAIWNDPKTQQDLQMMVTPIDEAEAWEDSLDKRDVIAPKQNLHKVVIDE